MTSEVDKTNHLRSNNLIKCVHGYGMEDLEKLNSFEWDLNVEVIYDEEKRKVVEEIELVFEMYCHHEVCSIHNTTKYHERLVKQDKVVKEYGSNMPKVTKARMLDELDDKLSPIDSVDIVGYEPERIPDVTLQGFVIPESVLLKRENRGRPKTDVVKSSALVDFYHIINYVETAEIRAEIEADKLIELEKKNLKCGRGRPGDKSRKAPIVVGRNGVDKKGEVSGSGVERVIGEGEKGVCVESVMNGRDVESVIGEGKNDCVVGVGRVESVIEEERKSDNEKSEVSKCRVKGLIDRLIGREGKSEVSGDRNDDEKSEVGVYVGEIGKVNRRGENSDDRKGKKKIMECEIEEVNEEEEKNVYVNSDCERSRVSIIEIGEASGSRSRIERVNGEENENVRSGNMGNVVNINVGNSNGECGKKVEKRGRKKGSTNVKASAASDRSVVVVDNEIVVRKVQTNFELHLFKYARENRTISSAQWNFHAYNELEKVKQSMRESIKNFLKDWEEVNTDEIFWLKKFFTFKAKFNQVPHLSDHIREWSDDNLVNEDGYRNGNGLTRHAIDTYTKFLKYCTNESVITYIKILISDQSPSETLFATPNKIKTKSTRVRKCKIPQHDPSAPNVAYLELNDGLKETSKNKVISVINGIPIASLYLLKPTEYVHIDIIKTLFNIPDDIKAFPPKRLVKKKSKKSKKVKVFDGLTDDEDEEGDYNIIYLNNPVKSLPFIPTPSINSEFDKSNIPDVPRTRHIPKLDDPVYRYINNKSKNVNKSVPLPTFKSSSPNNRVITIKEDMLKSKTFKRPNENLHKFMSVPAPVSSPFSKTNVIKPSSTILCNSSANIFKPIIVSPPSSYRTTKSSFIPQSVNTFNVYKPLSAPPLKINTSQFVHKPQSVIISQPAYKSQSVVIPRSVNIPQPINISRSINTTNVFKPAPTPNNVQNDKNSPIINVTDNHVELIDNCSKSINTDNGLYEEDLINFDEPICSESISTDNHSYDEDLINFDEIVCTYSNESNSCSESDDIHIFNECSTSTDDDINSINNEHEVKDDDLITFDEVLNSDDLITFEEALNPDDFNNNNSPNSINSDIVNRDDVLDLMYGFNNNNDVSISENEIIGMGKTDVSSYINVIELIYINHMKKHICKPHNVNNHNIFNQCLAVVYLKIVEIMGGKQFMDDNNL